MDFTMPAVIEMPNLTPERRAAAWSCLTRELFEWTQSTVARQPAEDFGARLRQLESWEPFVAGSRQFRPGDAPRIEGQYDIARAILWCGREAVAGPWTIDRSDRARFRSLVADAPSFVACREPWAWHCLHVLAGTGMPSRALTVPVVLSAGRLLDYADVAYLILELVDSGEGDVVAHPMQASLQCYADADFAGSIEDAWAAAWHLMSSCPGADVAAAGAGRDVAAERGRHVDGRWRLLLHDKPVAQVEGRSTAGAAARGWWHLLTGRVPDAGIFVLADIDAHGRLAGIGGIAAKIGAIARDVHADTVVLSSEDNYRDARRMLAGNSSICLVDLCGADPLS